MTSSPECDFIIPPIIEEGDGHSPPVSPTFTSESSIGLGGGQENAFDAIVRDLESWLDDMGREESPLLEQPPSNPMRIKRETKIAYIPYSDEHLPKLSDLLIAGQFKFMQMLANESSEISLDSRILHKFL